jgi:hypothetical protein
MKDFRELITQSMLENAIMSLTEKQIYDMAKKLAPKVLAEQMEGSLQDYIQEEIDFYEVFNKAGLSKKISALIINSLRDMK